MLERRRQQYLSILEIDNYFPKRILPGAPAVELLSDEHFQVTSPNLQSVDQHQTTIDSSENNTALEISAESDGIIAEGLKLADSQGPVDSPSPLIDSLLKEETDTPIEASESEHSLQKIADSETVEHSALNFVLTVWRINDECLIFDTRETGTALPTDRLLQNILRAIGLPLAQLPKSELIRWPLFSNQSFKKSSDVNEKDQARAMVHAFIHAQLSRAPVNTILLMGEQAASFALDETKEFSEVQGEVSNENIWKTKVVVTPSLHSMLQDPLLKKVAWKALRQIAQ
jgi:hypothetical protein